MALTLAINISPLTTQFAHAGTGDNYLWKSSRYPTCTPTILTGDIDPWGYCKRNCTSWVAWALHDRNGFEIPNIPNNAQNWGTWASANGYTVDTNPNIGAVAWWYAGALDDNYTVGLSGHVAWVGAVSGNTASIEEYNYGNNGLYHTRNITRSATQQVQYIHFLGLGEMGVVAPKDDFVIYRILNGNEGTWSAKRNEGGVATTEAIGGWIHGGQSGDIPLAADFTGDGIDDLGIFRIENGYDGTWYVEDGVTHAHTAIWGAVHGGPGDIPVVGDFDGDGYADFGIWRLVNGTNGTWYVRSGATGQQTAIWGAVHGSPGDIPVVGDFNGDHIDDFGIYRVSSGTGYWYVKSSANGQQVSSAWGVTHGGWAQDIPVTGDLDGDGYADFGIYRPSGGTGYWYVRSGVNTSSMIVNGATQGGWNGDIPMAGNFG